jgi:hypothetical protein
MSDVTAVVLSVGEPHTERALASVARQTLPPVETILVERVSPFHRALNSGAQRVRTPFFVQVDADMIANPWCVEELRQHVAPAVGIVVGPLWDPLMGVEVGIKLYRRQCFDAACAEDTLSPDTDFNATLRRLGWETVFALPSPHHREGPTPWPTMGAHDPPYTPLYTYARYRVLGARYTYRRDFAAFRWRYRKLCASRHPTAFIARIALARGLFLRTDRDLLTSDLYSRSPEFEALERFLGEREGAAERAVEILPFLDGEPDSVFEAFRRLAMALCGERQPTAFRRCLDILDAADHPNAWVARVALAQGVSSERHGEGRSSEYERIRDFLPSCLGPRDGGPRR